MFSEPLAYFLTFRTYGTWLHGDNRGSVSRTRNEFGAPQIPPDPEWEAFDERHLRGEPVNLSAEQRECVERTIRGVCEYKKWGVHALNARTNHVHLIVSAFPKRPEPVMNALKSWATRGLRDAGLVGRDASVWARHGSTQYIFTPEKLAEKIHYVLNQQ